MKGAAMTTPSPSGESKVIPPANTPSISVQTRMIVMLAVAALVPRKDNREVTAEDVSKSGLLASIKARGVLVPLLVRKLADLYEVVAGHRRLFCLKLLGRDKVPCIVLEGDVSDAQVIEVGFAENVLRKAMSTAEQLDFILQYMKLTGCTQTEVGERLHLSQGYISRILNRQLYSPDLRKLVESGKLRPSAADTISRLGSPELEAQAIAFALSLPKKSRDEIKAYCDRLKGNGNKGKEKKPKAIKGNTPSGSSFSYQPKRKMGGEEIVEDIKGILALFRKYVNLPPEAWGHLFNGNS
jgi:ParB family chromosome partitioning protein